MMGQLILLMVLAIQILNLKVDCLKLQPIQEGKTHTIQNQDDGSYLVVSSEGKVTTGEFTGRPGQKWIFNGEPQGQEIYRMTDDGPTKNFIRAMNQQWQLIKVGHGKRHIKNVESQLCLQSSGRGRPVMERECSRDYGKQRWYVEAKI